jgi:hypothetical protein
MTNNRPKYNTVKNTILSDRSSGFKNTAYAVAELIDNSIQSNFRINQNNCEVSLIIVEEKTSISGKSYDRISEIHVHDEAEGMSEKKLGIALSKGQSENKKDKGFGKMGRYGFGLYMSSISQCRRTEIHTWQDNKFHKSWLDIDEIIDGEIEIEYVPVEKLNDLPNSLKSIIPKKRGKNGTIVSWTNLDRTRWKTAEGLYNHVENEIGRMYRYFINNKSIQIKFKHFKKSGGNYKLIEENTIKPNDPMYLMSNTTCPKPWNNKPGFVESKSESVFVNLNGQKKEIKLKFAIAKEVFRGIEEAHGRAPHGKHAANNNGVSIVRSGRELELNTSWNNPSDSRWRWINAEIHFEGDEDIDTFLKVPTNKQSADALYYRNIKKKAEDRGLTEPAFMSQTQERDIEEYIHLDISRRIKSRLDNLASTIREWRKNKGPKKPITGSAEDITSKARDARKKKTEGDKKHAASTKEQRLKLMMDRLIAGGMDAKTAKEMATISIDRNISTVITAEEIKSNPIFFDIRIVEGQYQIIINKSHPAYLDFFNLLEKESDGKTVNEPSSDRAIKLMLAAWACLEDDASTDNSEYANHLQDIRLRWGQLFRDLLTQEKSN